LRFGLDRLVDPHVPFLVQRLLRHRVGERWSAISYEL
jgi:hypothetical protein